MPKPLWICHCVSPLMHVFLKVNKLLLLIIHFWPKTIKPIYKRLPFDTCKAWVFFFYLLSCHRKIFSWFGWFGFILLCFFSSMLLWLDTFLCCEDQENPKQKGEFISYSSWKYKDRAGSMVGRFSGDFFLLSSALQDTCFNSSLLSNRTAKCARNRTTSPHCHL